MSGILPNEGEHLIANLVFKNADADRGTDLELGLFTNPAIGENITASALTEPIGGSYARKILTDADWTVVADTAAYAKQTFDGGYDGTIYGYFIVTTGTTPRILAIEVDPAGPYTLAVDVPYEVTPTLTVA